MIGIHRELFLLVLAALRAYRASLKHDAVAEAKILRIIVDFQECYK